MHELIKILVLMFLVIDGVIMGIGSDGSIRLDPALLRSFEIAGLALLSVYTLEISLQLLYRGLNILKPSGCY